MFEQKIDNIVKQAILDFINKKDTKSDEGIISENEHPLYYAIPKQIREYAKKVTSFTISCGYIYEKIYFNICNLFKKEVSKEIKGYITAEQDAKIVEYINDRTHHVHTSYDIFDELDKLVVVGDKIKQKTYKVDTCFLDDDDTYYIVESKLSGNMDNKKSKSEKTELLKRYCVLKNNGCKKVKPTMGVIYNLYGEGETWHQERVLQFFDRTEIFLGLDFWKSATNSEKYANCVINSLKKHRELITKHIFQEN